MGARESTTNTMEPRRAGAAQPSTSAASTSTAAGSPSAPAPPQDERVHFNRESGKWAFEDDQGDEFEWDAKQNAWMPVFDDDLLKAQQAAYAVEGVDENAPAAILARDRKRKAKEDGEAPGKKAKRPPKQPVKNTAIFVSNLPESATVDMIRDTFSKAGLIMEDADGEPRIKLYTDPETGRFKREALIVYLVENSVDLAVRLLDDSELVLGSGDGNMRVRKAEWDASAATNGEGATKKVQRTEEERKKIGKRAERQKKKLTDWSSDEEDAKAAARQQSQRVVVLEGMFSLQELERDPTLLLDLKEDVRDECGTIGDVTNVTLYDKEADGVMTVRFREPIAAQACVARMNGRFFGGRSIKSYLFDGRRRFHKSGQGISLEGTGFDDDAEGMTEEERLDKFASWLENAGD